MLTGGCHSEEDVADSSVLDLFQKRELFQELVKDKAQLRTGDRNDFQDAIFAVSGTFTLVEHPLADVPAERGAHARGAGLGALSQHKLQASPEGGLVRSCVSMERLQRGLCRCVFDISIPSSLVCMAIND